MIERFAAAPGVVPEAGAARAAHTPAVVFAPAMQRVFAMLRQLQHATLPLLVLGETGSGKEVVAEWAHHLSALSTQAFVKTNCAGLTESLVESELFGHERGAFTGALQTHRGLFEVAHGGTLFLDEVGELPLRTQAKLLRVLESGEFCRLGSNTPRRAKVRIIAATHRDLEARVARGDFRSDLYFRLNGVTIVVPPLRERPEDVVPLARRFLERASAQLHKPELMLGADAVELLLRHDWPGNVRELRNAIDCAAALCPGNVLDAAALTASAAMRGGATKLALPGAASQEMQHRARPRTESVARLRRQVLDFERERIRHAIEQSAGNQTAAAKLLGISRRTLTNKLNRHELSRPRKASAPEAWRGALPSSDAAPPPSSR